MPDARRHRGAHPEDARNFAESQQPALVAATRELSWLLDRGYSELASLKLVGDHHQLTSRQRQAVSRAACTDAQRVLRGSRKRIHTALADATLVIDGFNCLITLESMLARAPVFLGRDSATRDLASVHGTYRGVSETEPAVDALASTLARHGVREARLWLDRPVGNSGKLRAVLERAFSHHAFVSEIILSDSVDRELIEQASLTASSDSWILDRASTWIDLPALVAADLELSLWCVDLRTPLRI